MKYIKLKFIIFITICFAFVQKIVSLDNGLGLTPQMGWNTWNKFGCNINEQLIRETIDFFNKSGLIEAGYKYINLDDCWQIERDNITKKIIADPQAFPSGIKNLADYAHEKGLFFGLYSDAGEKTCAGRPGSLGYEKEDAGRVGEVGHQPFVAGTIVEEVETQYLTLQLHEGHVGVQFAHRVDAAPVHILIGVVLQQVAEGLDAEFGLKYLLARGSYPRCVHHVLFQYVGHMRCVRILFSAYEL